MSMEFIITEEVRAKHQVKEPRHKGSSSLRCLAVGMPLLSLPINTHSVSPAMDSATGVLIVIIFIALAVVWIWAAIQTLFGKRGGKR